jgi:type IV secretory pathway VirB10-like protein
MEVKKLKQALAAVVINISEEDGSVSAAVRMTVEDELLSETPQVTRIVDNLDDVPLQEMFEELLGKFNMLAVEDQSKKKPRMRKPTAEKSAKPKLFENNKEKASDKDSKQPADDDEENIAGADDEEEEPAEDSVEEEEEEEEDVSKDDHDEVASDNEDDEDDENVEVEEEDASETAEDEEDAYETDEEENQDQAPRQISLDDMF